jgi:hypothetical protein
MSEHQRSLTTPAAVIDALAELIDVLDRRVPHVESAGEAQIAKDAAMLRDEALSRIEELKLKRGIAGDHFGESELADAIMADDGWPSGR